MKKKILTKQIVLALAMAGLFPMGQAWAGYFVDGETLHVDQNLDAYRNETIEGKHLGDFKEIHITTNNDYGLNTYSGQFNLPTTDIYINVTGDSSHENRDGVSLRNWGSTFIANKYVAHIDAPISDALNLSRDSTNLYAEINDLDVTVERGHGIRANTANSNHSPADDNNVNHIVVNNHAKITINSNRNSDISTPTAVFAGTDYWRKGKGTAIVDLKGSSEIYLNGEHNYGIFAGRNGNINVNNFTIIAEKDNSVGIRASGESLNWGFDLSPTVCESTVTLYGANNVITMKGENSQAIYAKGTDKNGNSNTVKSGENGIGYLWAKGNIAAEDSGAIVLSMNNAMQDEANPDEKVSFYLNGAAMASNGGQTVLKSAYDNWITSSNVVYTSGSVLNRKNVVSALYADNGTVKISGASNVISSSYENM